VQLQQLLNSRWNAGSGAQVQRESAEKGEGDHVTQVSKLLPMSDPEASM